MMWWTELHHTVVLKKRLRVENADNEMIFCSYNIMKKRARSPNFIAVIYFIFWNQSNLNKLKIMDLLWAPQPLILFCLLRFSVVIKFFLRATSVLCVWVGKEKIIAARLLCCCRKDITASQLLNSCGTLISYSTFFWFFHRIFVLKKKLKIN